MTFCLSCNNYRKFCTVGRLTKYQHGGKRFHSGDVSVSESGDETVCLGFVPYVDCGLDVSSDHTDAQKHRRETYTRRRSIHRKSTVCQFCGYHVCRCSYRAGFT